MKYPLARAHINLDAIRYNIRNLKSVTQKNAKFMAVVKADAYGHGALKVARAAVQEGADWLGVARLHEALELREAGIKSPLLIFGYFPPSLAGVFYENDLTATVYDYGMAGALSERACQKNIRIKAHLKVDTGMGRAGIIIGHDRGGVNSGKKILEQIRDIVELPGIDLRGIYTHFAAADSRDRSYTELQIDLFGSLIRDLEKIGIEFELCHAANSAGIIGYPDSHFDMVRSGIAVYGLYPSGEVDKSRVKLVPGMELKSVITSVKKVPERFMVSYGMTYETRKETVLASVPVGYADGFSRLFSSNGFMLVRGKRASIVGRVCMDQTIIDVGHVGNIKVLEEVVLIGSQGDETISADELASRAGTINYEIVSSLTSRIERFYSDSG